MPNISNFQVQTSIGSAQSIEISGPEELSILTSITLQVALADGTTYSRTFAGTRDEYQDRSIVDHPGGRRTYTSVIGIDDASLDTQLATELITDEERGPNLYDTNPYPLTAVLGYGLDLNELCENLMPTRFTVAERAIAEAGFDLIIHKGPGLPFLGEKVNREYRTEGKTPRRVLQDMLLETQPRVWYTNNAVRIDGRGLRNANAPNFTYATHETAIEKEANTEEPIAPINEAVVLSSYELADDYTLEWTETAGEETDYTQTTTHYRIEKVAGQVTEEHTTVYGYLRRANNIANPTGWFYSWEKLYESSAWHTYHPLSSKALVQSHEVVRVANAITAHWDGATLKQEDYIATKISDLHTVISTLYGMVETRRHQVWQTWHAEGWLRSKIEDTIEPSGWVVSNTDTQAGGFTYRRLTRREVNTPIGQGIWNVQATDTITTEKPVHELINPNAVKGDDDYQVVFYSHTYPVENSTTQHIVTDQAPPSVTINPDSCDERTDYEIEVDAYDREVAIKNAIISNNPDKRLNTFTIPGLALEFKVGQFLSGGAFVASVTYELNTDNGQASTTVTFWTLYGA